MKRVADTMYSYRRHVCAIVLFLGTILDTGMQYISLFTQLGISEKAAQVYLALLSYGPSSVRRLAQSTQLNRGSTYDYLKQLEEKGCVSYIHAGKKQQFVAVDPKQLHALFLDKKEELDRAYTSFQKVLPELEAIQYVGSRGPVARYFEKKDIHLILEDVLETCAQSATPLYRVYSVEGVRALLYEKFPTFSDVRIAKGVAVRAIALGGGGELRGLDERRYLTSAIETPTYIMIYPGKTAYISLRGDEVVGVVIENKGISETQQVIFDTLWETL